MRRRYDFDQNDKSSYDLTLDSERNKNNIYSVPFYTGFGVLIVLLGLYGVVFLIDKKLPTPLNITDEKDYPDAFITERAVNDLRSLTSIGPRITGGYENEVLAVDFLTREINSIKDQAHKNQQIELDVQVVSGAYNLKLQVVDQINVYANVQNVVVKLYGRNSSSGSSLLVNSHFDSVPTSPGGSDDGINVVAMLEILRKLSRSPEPAEHNIIFLFNGAEETPLQAAHGFITQHKWAAECKVVINLEAAGAGGKIVLFQTGPEAPWLMKYYSQVPHPYGQAAGEEIFQSGVIPSDTDFKLFRDFGGLVGVDMAFFKNGYRYHTKYDDFKNIPPGSYQHVGDNALSLIKSLANAPELTEPKLQKGKVVYFDVFGWFMVSYTTLIANVLNGLTIIISGFAFAYSFMDFKLGLSKALLKYVFLVIGAILLGWILAAVAVYIIALILDNVNKTMSWYGKPWFIFGLYVVPTIGMTGSLLSFVNHENLALNVRCQIQAHLLRLIWTLVLMTGTILGIRSMYALMIPVLFNSLAFIIIHTCRWQHTIRKWQLVYFACLIIPTMLLMYQTLTTLSLFIPITGRFGSNKNPELIIGMMTLFFTILSTSPLVILTNSIKNLKYYFIGLGVIFAVFIIMVVTPLGFPYSGNPDSPTPQRQWILHTRRNFHNEDGALEKTDSGIFLLNLDRNSPNILRPYIDDLSKAKSMEEDCKKYLLCGLPLSHSKMIEVMQYSTWIPANQPIIHGHLKFSVNSKEQLSPTLIRYNITASGPDRLGCYLLPKSGTKLVNTSLVQDLREPHFLQNDRPYYFILFSYGKEPADLTFTFDIEVQENYNETITVDIAVVAKYVHDNTMIKTPYYINLINKFPDWADVTPWLGIYSSYII